jgi:hypothetical protein
MGPGDFRVRSLRTPRRAPSVDGPGHQRIDAVQSGSRSRARVSSSFTLGSFGARAGTSVLECPSPVPFVAPAVWGWSDCAVEPGEDDRVPVDDVALFQLAVPEAELDDLRARLDATRWPEPATDPAQGVAL